MSNLKSLAIEKEELSLKLDNAITLPNIMNSDRLMNNLSETDMSQLIFEFQKTDNILFYENEALNQIIYSGGLKEIKNNRIRAL